MRTLADGPGVPDGNAEAPTRLEVTVLGTIAAFTYRRT